MDLVGRRWHHIRHGYTVGWMRLVVLVAVRIVGMVSVVWWSLVMMMMLLLLLLRINACSIQHNLPAAKLFSEHLLLGTVLPPRKLIKPKVEIIREVGARPPPRLVTSVKGLIQVHFQQGCLGARVEGDGVQVNLLGLLLSGCRGGSGLGAAR
jgi:hypothetical protein